MFSLRRSITLRRIPLRDNILKKNRLRHTYQIRRWFSPCYDHNPELDDPEKRRKYSNTYEIYYRMTKGQFDRTTIKPYFHHSFIKETCQIRNKMVKHLISGGQVEDNLKPLVIEELREHFKHRIEDYKKTKETFEEIQPRIEDFNRKYDRLDRVLQENENRSEIESLTHVVDIGYEFWSTDHETRVDCEPLNILLK